MKKPDLYEYSSGLPGVYAMQSYYNDLAAYWEHVAKECLEHLDELGEVYKDEWNQIRWKDTGAIVGG